MWFLDGVSKTIYIEDGDKIKIMEYFYKNFLPYQKSFKI
jgi:hypothetical protein